MTVVTRFAPSPTGYLHIGGARTALFCWLYARHTGGKFLLRIEDTDKERSTEDAVRAIFDGLGWLGLAGDEPPVMQGARADRHREVALEMVNRGTAFRCYATAEEMQAARDAAYAEGRAVRSPFRKGGAMEGQTREGPFVVRLQAPDDAAVAFTDRVQGAVQAEASNIDDLILLRSDGTPTYMLAVVVDDHDMGITHVIRGDDHLNNTYRQIPIYRGMGWDTPDFAHVPMIHGPDGKKLSKRHGATGVEAYRDELGYLPEGLKNYLLRLGWSHGDDEIIPEDKAIEWFDLDGLNRSPARLDLAKLNSINAHYMALADDQRLMDLFLARPEAKAFSAAALERVRGAMSVLKTRSPNLVMLAEQARFLGDIRPVELSGKAAALVNDEAKTRLAGLAGRLKGLADWTEPAIKDVLTQYCADIGVGLGKIGPVLRAVLTGGAASPDITLVLALLGRNECLARIQDQTGETV
jgi:glutamyl-tRNA synthetase